ncbi:HNH endonuclease [Pantoea sp.]|uniref:HNH endonuclease n=1 Tax=Pantoea sp. TaxID=69393 RepID=UPI0025E2B1EC|nr:HNH endonuclease [Pantoea sp.]
MFNVKKCKTPPASLENKVDYDGEDVYKQLRKDFHDKCYICETPQPLSINIEHFISHRNKDEDKKFNWNNLYFACARCNNIKGARYDGILDCCDDSVDVYKSLKLLPPRTPYVGSLDIFSKSTSPEALKTVDLLSEVYNNANTVNKVASAEFLRERIFEQYAKLYKYILIWHSPESFPAEKEDARERMKLFIATSSPYSAFMREVLFDDSKLKDLIEELVD